jgi:RNA polymerase sigma-70 factor, ECF subfamily
MVDGSKGSAQPEDSALVRAVKAGDRDAFDTLVERYGRHVLRYLESLCRGSVEADDLAQEVLLQAYRKIGTFNEDTDFRAWLLTIAYHAWVHWLRKKRPVTTDPEDLKHVAAAVEATGDDELAADVRKSIEALPDDQRAVVALRFGEGLSHAEIAEITKSEVATVRWRLFKARQTLQRVLRKWVAGKGSEK